MAVNKIVYNQDTLLDLTQDTVAPESLLAGKTAHNAAGEKIIGTYSAPNLENYVTLEEFNKLKSRVGRCGGFYT